MNSVSLFHQGHEVFEDPGFDAIPKDQLTGAFIHQCLAQLIGDEATIIHPDLGSINNMFSSHEQQAKAGAFTFIQQIQNIKEGLPKDDEDPQNKTNMPESKTNRFCLEYARQVFERCL